ncbi:MAG: type III-B CRISPR-associated protein Cas10/Cmr2 [Brevinematia bacterium]
MPFTKRDQTYWNNKLLAYLHDPPDKLLDIQGHKERAKKILEVFGLQIPDNFDIIVEKPDRIASGFERGDFPSYNKDPNQNGAVDFKSSPILTHPLSGEKLNLTNINPSSGNNNEVIDLIKDVIGISSENIRYSDNFTNNSDKSAIARFLYTHLALRFKLASDDNVAGLGALWHRIPADSRIPDHSIWHHNALASAIYSCMNPDSNPEITENITNVGIMIFSISPVQSFITKARKLRDFWTGSILLSWLTFEGIRWIIENLGPDHILFPSIVDQPLVIEYLRKNWKMEEKYYPSLHKETDIATFPNKFMFLVPMNYSKDIGEGITTHIKTEWKKITLMVYDYIKEKLNLSKDQNNIKTLFDEQNENYWDIHWAVTPLVTSQNLDESKDLLSENLINKVKEQVDIFHKIYSSPNCDSNHVGKYYPLSNGLIQGALSALKMSYRNIRTEQQGKKCTLCGELEALTDKPYTGNESANEYKTNMDNFWKTLRETLGFQSDEKKESGELKENERLCSVCLTKRLLSDALIWSESKKEEKDRHILYSTFTQLNENKEITKKYFPSTSYIALYEYFERKKITNEEEKERKSQVLFDSEDGETLPDLKIQDKYYAILMMDGDKMGKLIMGETIEASWEDVIHPEIKDRMIQENFEEKYRKNWKILYDKPRLITPAIHSAISEALADFAIYEVPQIIKKYEGRLIYAGGDDVCAVLPIAEAINAAKELSEAYKRSFRLISKIDDGYEVKYLNTESNFEIKPGKLSIGMGSAEDITISASILICHYKEPLTAMLRRARELLDDVAKDEAGRNTCAIELYKRNGEYRRFWFKWNDNEVIDAIEKLTAQKGLISNSFIYNLDFYKEGVLAILENDDKNYKEKLKDFIKSLLKKSKTSKVGNEEVYDSKVDNEGIYDNIASLICKKDKKNKWIFSTDILKIISFIAGGKDERNLLV